MQLRDVVYGLSEIVHAESELYSVFLRKWDNNSIKGGVVDIFLDVVVFEKYISDHKSVIFSQGVF